MIYCTRCNKKLTTPQRQKVGLCYSCEMGRTYGAHKEETVQEWLARRQQYQVKIRRLGDTRPWEEIPVTETWQFIHPDSPAEHARTMKQFDESIREIRINEPGSLQGVYI